MKNHIRDMGDFALDETALPMANAFNKQIEDQVIESYLLFHFSNHNVKVELLNHIQIKIQSTSNN